MALRYDFLSERFRNERGQFVSRSSGMRSSVARVQFQQAQTAAAAGRAALEFLAPTPAPVRTPRADEFPPSGFITMPIVLPTPTDQLQMEVAASMSLDELYNMLDVDTDEDDPYEEVK